MVASFGEAPEQPHPKPGKPGKPLTPIVQTFEIGQVVEMVKFISALAAKPHRNVYVPLAVLRPDLSDNTIDIDFLTCNPSSPYISKLTGDRW